MNHSETPDHERYLLPQRLAKANKKPHSAIPLQTPKHNVFKSEKLSNRGKSPAPSPTTSTLVSACPAKALDTDFSTVSPKNNLGVIKKTPSTPLVEKKSQPKIISLLKPIKTLKNSIDSQQNLLPTCWVLPETVGCVACGSFIATNPRKIRKHPKLDLIICSECVHFYSSGQWKRDSEGHFIYCQCCGDGGAVICCAKCDQVACRSCLKRLLGKEKLATALEKDWQCLSCAPLQIAKLREEANHIFAVMKLEPGSGSSRVSGGGMSVSAVKKPLDRPSPPVTPLGKPLANRFIGMTNGLDSDESDSFSESTDAPLNGTGGVEESSWQLLRKIKGWRVRVDTFRRKNDMVHRYHKEGKTPPMISPQTKTPNSKKDFLKILATMREEIETLEKSLNSSVPSVKVVNIMSDSFKEAENCHTDSPDLQGRWMLADDGDEGQMSDEDDEETAVIRVGPEYQADVPVGLQVNKVEEKGDVLVWSPNVIKEEETKDYLKQAFECKCGLILALTNTQHMRDDEKALFILHQSNYDPQLGISILKQQLQLQQELLEHPLVLKKLFQRQQTQILQDTSVQKLAENITSEAILSNKRPTVPSTVSISDSSTVTTSARLSSEVSSLSSPFFSSISTIPSSSSSNTNLESTTSKSLITKFFQPISSSNTLPNQKEPLIEKCLQQTSDLQGDTSKSLLSGPTNLGSNCNSSVNHPNKNNCSTAITHNSTSTSSHFVDNNSLGASLNNNESLLSTSTPIVFQTTARWTEAECHAFERGIRKKGKNFYLIHKNFLPSRSVAEIVQFYYLWKKTERRDLILGIGKQN